MSSAVATTHGFRLQIARTRLRKTRVGEGISRGAGAPCRRWGSKFEASSSLPRTSASASNAQAAVKPKITPPPPGYSYRDATADATRRVCEERYPELMDLFEDGTLVYMKRPDTYVERRVDGYQVLFLL